MTNVKQIDGNSSNHLKRKIGRRQKTFDNDDEHHKGII
jgi:hypothetical protein